MSIESQLMNRSWSMLREFDRKRRKLYPITVANKVRRTVSVSVEVAEAARARGLSLSEYLDHLHVNQRASRIAHCASIFRGFALLEMARVPIDPAYFELVEGCLGEEEGHVFRIRAGSGEDYALAKAAARLLGTDSRAKAIEAIMITSQRAQVPHEGMLEAARLLEATFYR